MQRLEVYYAADHDSQIHYSTPTHQLGTLVGRTDVERGSGSSSRKGLVNWKRNSVVIVSLAKHSNHEPYCYGRDGLHVREEPN